MTDLIALAKQVNAQVFGDAMHPDRAVASFFLDQLQAFADLIAAREREECAVVAETQWFKSDMRLWEAIRARGAKA